MQRSTLTFLKYIPPTILAVSLMLVYLNTMAPGLTWANEGSDGGDLIAATATGGVAHPTGYPSYLLLARLFQLLPLKPLAYRTNLMSAVATVAASTLVYCLVTRSMTPTNWGRYWPAGLTAGVAFGLSPLVWSQAVITEVYGLQALFIVLILYLSSGVIALPSRKYQDCFLGIMLGLALGNHATTIILLPIVFLSNMVVHRKNTMNRIQHSKRLFWNDLQLDGGSFFRQSIFLGVGALVYLILPLHALTHPPVNWGNPITWEGFRWLVSGQLYQDQLFHLSIWDVWSRIQAWAVLLIKQFGIPGLMIGLIGLVFFFTFSKTYLLTLCTAVAFSTFAIIYSSPDSYVYLIPAFISFSIWIGLTTGSLMDLATEHLPGLRWGIFLVLTLYLLGLSVPHWRQVDASHDLRAESFGREFISSTPANAIVFAKGDRSVFAMW
jgi:hypothetical protein